MSLFYVEAILSKKGPLAKVWLAAHYERKLSKVQTLQTDISQSTKAIEDQPMALRLSGQLLLGVCRIYSRKAKYLLDDCNEALMKIKLAFRPGVVDMTDEQLTVPANAITLQGDGFNLDLFGDTWEFDGTRQTGGRHLAREADINLPMHDDFTITIDAGADWGLDGDLGELGVNFGDEPNVDVHTLDINMDEDDSIEIGRDAAEPRSARDSFASMLKAGNEDDHLSIISKDQEPNPFGDMDNFDFDAGMDLGLDFGDDVPPAPSELEKTPGGSRASSPLTAVPDTPAPEEDLEPIAKKTPKKRKPKEKKVVIDAVTELNKRDGGLGELRKVDVSDITTVHPFLPSSPTIAQLLEIRADPISHFFPTKTTDKGTFMCLGPVGLAPQLAEMFMFPTSASAGQKRKNVAEGGRDSKRPRLESEPVDDIEVLRRQSVAPSVHGDITLPPIDDVALQDIDMDMGLDVGDDYQLQVDESLQLPKDRSRHTTPGSTYDPDEGLRSYADASCVVAMFDSQQATQDPSQPPEDTTVVNDKGYSKNTLKALGLLRDKLRPSEEEEDVSLSFVEATDKASRRAASAFFFELLVLGTRDCVKLTQSSPFENIEVRAKSKLWQGSKRHPAASVRASSVMSGF